MSQKLFCSKVVTKITLEYFLSNLKILSISGTFAPFHVKDMWQYTWWHKVFPKNFQAMFTFLYPSFLSLIQQILEYFETIPLNQQPLNSLFVNFFSQILYFFATSMNYKMDSVVPLLILQVKDIGRFPPFSILLKSFHFSFKSNGFQHLLASYDEPCNFLKKFRLLLNFLQP